MTARRRNLRFRGPAGQHLAGRLELPAGEPVAYALFAHCFTCTKDLKSAHRISHALVERGLAVLRFDFTGIGESEGQFADTNFTTNVADLLAAVAMLREHYAAPRLLIGHSLGGTAVLAAAAEVPEVRALVTIAAPLTPAHLAEKLRRLAPDLATAEAARVDVMGRVVTVKRQMLDDFAQHTLAEHIAALPAPLLVLHSPQDEVLDISHAHRLFDAAPHPKSLVALAGMDHLMLRDEAFGGHVGALIATWAAPYLADNAAPRG
jgi:alpha/beta superfamily hydrolase